MIETNVVAGFNPYTTGWKWIETSRGVVESVSRTSWSDTWVACAGATHAGRRRPEGQAIRADPGPRHGWEANASAARIMMKLGLDGKSHSLTPSPSPSPSPSLSLSLIPPQLFCNLGGRQRERRPLRSSDWIRTADDEVNENTFQRNRPTLY